MSGNKDKENARTLKQMAAYDALMIVAGACNGRGIARTLVEAYDAFKDEGTDASNTSAPVKLILHQLSFLSGTECGGYLSLSEFSEADRACRALVRENPDLQASLDRTVQRA